jgi:hypothetical protein
MCLSLSQIFRSSEASRFFGARFYKHLVPLGLKNREDLSGARALEN